MKIAMIISILLFGLEAYAQFNFFHGILAQCPQGQHKEAGGCVSNVRSCSVANGSGTQAWTGGSYSSCSATACNYGYYQNGSSCDPMRKCRGDIYAATYTEGNHGSDDVSHTFNNHHSLPSGHLNLSGRDAVVWFQWHNVNSGHTHVGHGPIPLGMNWSTGYGRVTRVMQIEIYNRPELFSVETCTDSEWFGPICSYSPSYGYLWHWWDGSARQAYGGSLIKGAFLRHGYVYVYPWQGCTANNPVDMGLSVGPQ